MKTPQTPISHQERMRQINRKARPEVYAKYESNRTHDEPKESFLERTFANPAQAPGNCQTSHSPLPWHDDAGDQGEIYDATGCCIADNLHPANARYIVERVNDSVPDDVYLIIKKQRDADEANLKAHAQRLSDALKFYVSICGNTAHQISRETAQEMYDSGSEALAQWEGSK